MNIFSLPCITRFACILSLIAWGLTVVSHPAAAEILAADSFDYPEGSDLNGQEGGSGDWMSPWNQSESRDDVSFEISKSHELGTSLLVKSIDLEEGKHLFIKRDIAPYVGDTIFAAFKLQVVEVPGEKCKFYFWFHKRGSWLSLYRLNVGVTDGLLVASFYPDKGNTISGPSVAPGDVLFVIGEFSKSISGESEFYDTIKLWVNPSLSDYATPIGEKTSASDSIYRTDSIEIVGFTATGPQAGSFRIKNLVITTTWDDAVKTFEPSVQQN